MGYESDTIQQAWGLVCWMFLHNGGMHAPSQAAFELDTKMHDSARHFGGSSMDGLQVRIAPALARLPHEVLLGVLAHEAGHVEDFCSPGEYGLRRGRLIVYEPPVERKQSYHEIEVVADKIAGLGMGEKIGYVNVEGVGWIQCLGDGIARPKGLR